jgi:hypothetical protein
MAGVFEVPGEDGAVQARYGGQDEQAEQRVEGDCGGGEPPRQGAAIPRRVCSELASVSRAGVAASTPRCTAAKHAAARTTGTAGGWPAVVSVVVSVRDPPITASAAWAAR